MFDLLWTKPRVVGGVLITPPTVRTFFRALEKFPQEIGVFREAASRLDEPLSLDAALALFTTSLEDGRLEYVLEDCLRPWTSDGRRPAPDLIAALRAVVETFNKNVKRINTLLGDPTVEITEETVDGDDIAYLLICADRFHLDPRVVLDWPLGLFLDVIDAVLRSARGRAETPTARNYVPVETMLGAMGIPTVSPVEQTDTTTTTTVVEAAERARSFAGDEHGE